MNAPAHHKKRLLAATLVGLFVLALFMGPGPGILLVNPDPADDGARRLVFGVPVVYAWASFWFGVQALVVALAYRLLWRAPDAE